MPLEWINFWLWLCIIMIGAFVVIAIIIIPLGALDLLKLYRVLMVTESKHSDDK
jgi:uncharacterized membrane protein YccF (DUF307 family)